MIGLREKIQGNPIFHGKIYGFLQISSLSQPIDKWIIYDNMVMNGWWSVVTCFFQILGVLRLQFLMVDTYLDRYGCFLKKGYP